MNRARSVTAGWWVMATVLALGACGDHSGEPSSKPAESSATGPDTMVATMLVQAPAAIRERLQVAPVALRRVPEIVTAPGEVLPDLKRVAKVSPRIDGTVEQLYVSLGERVRVGQPLAAIGGHRFDELVEHYLVSKAQAEAADTNFKRTEQLAADGIVAERRLVEERGRHLEAKARYQHVREKLLNMGLTEEELRDLEQAAHEERHRYLLRSPLAGTVVKQHVVLGQGVSSGATLFEVVDTSRVWVFANLPLEQARQFTAGDLGTIVPTGSEPVQAPLSDVSPVADETTRTIRARFDVSNKHGRLKPHEYVDVRMTFEGTPTPTVPVSAVTMVNKARGVFVQKEQGYLFTPIETGREGGGLIEVKAGVAVGETVVTSGVFDLKSVLLKTSIQGEE